MFDISFAELMIIAVVALLVIGPEKLPTVARTIGAYAGRLQRYVTQIKEEVNREVRFEELQKLQQEIKQGVHKAESSMMAGAESVEEALVSAKVSVKHKRKTVAAKPLAQKQSIKKTIVNQAVVKKAPAKNSSVRKSPVKKAIVKPNVDKV